MGKVTKRRTPKNPDRELARLKAAAQKCHACDLYKNATQTVFGEGSGNAQLMLVGEQPGNREDLEGRPFVGPAGSLLAKLLSRAQLKPEQIYISNAVKHFKWVPRGKIRLHKKPNMAEINACRRWLEAEIKTIRPRAILCLGITAAQSVLGSTIRINRDRGTVFRNHPLAPAIVVSWHPSAFFRASGPEMAKKIEKELLEDLLLVARESKA